MGVMATYCQLCGMPLQHDHYVPTGREDSWSIYRSSEPRLVKPAVEFDSQHEWLTRAVGLNAYAESEPVLGVVEDGHLCDGAGNYHFVCRGDEDLHVLHEACWEIAGRPRSFEQLRAAPHLHHWVLLARYHEQLFEFAQLIADGRAAWLVDPRLSEGGENRSRIEAWLAETRRVAALGPARTARELAESNSWSRFEVNHQDVHSFWRYRDNFARGLDLQNLNWVNMGIGAPFEGVADGPHTLALEKFETQMLEVLRPLAVVLACRGKTNQWDYLCYTDRMAECEAALRGLGRELEFDSLSEPNWDNYWPNLHPHLAGRYQESS